MKTILIGFDAFDPGVFEKLHSEGKTPNLSKYVNNNGYKRFSVTNPPQSEVSWTSIATGLNPGGHGIFDFVHRNPGNYGRQVSLLTSKSNILGKQFVPPFSAPTIFDSAVEDGYPAISIWWPATFPAKQSSPVGSLPGLGTPDIFGRLGVGICYSMEDRINGSKTRIEKFEIVSKGKYQGSIIGPQQVTLTGAKDTSINFKLQVLNESNAKLILNKTSYELGIGEWSPIIELTFKVGFGVSVMAVTRAILTQIHPEPILYFLPLQLHPLRSPWPYGTPKKMLKSIWNNPGPYLTLGWPQDTTGLEEGFINDQQFLQLCDSINYHREKTLLNLIDNFNEGMLACVFDSLDRIQHMFYRDREDIIESWYIKLDALFGRIIEKTRSKSALKDVRIIGVSDHGFTQFKYKVNVNNWLIQNGYLQPEQPADGGNLNQVDWNRSTAYAIGLNSVYLNLEGREGNGVVSPAESSVLLQQLKKDLLSWHGPNDQSVVSMVQTNQEAFEGAYSKFGPDLVIGYNDGYRASSETGMGEWGASSILDNGDHWGADHCIDPNLVPGVLFSNNNLDNLSNPSYKDIPILALDKEIKLNGKVSEPTFSDEDQEVLDERLKELGYL